MSQYERAKLYEEVWKEPVSVVAKRYGVSDTALAKACRRLNVPLPPRGYWEKVRAGASVSIPALPEYKPERPGTVPPKAKEKPQSVKMKPQDTEKKPQSTKKKQVRSEFEDSISQRIHAFLRGHMLEKEDLIHHFQYLISCLEKENYDGYTDEYKRRRTEFLQECIIRIKSAHLPPILAPWTSYECSESTSGFSICICEIKKMTIENDGNVSEEVEELHSVMQFPYRNVSISEYASIHQVSEETVLEWLNNGRLSGASLEDGEWKIPELHRIPEGNEYTVYLEFNPDESVNIAEYPLLSSCTELWVKPEGRRYLLMYFSEKGEMIGQLHISKKEKGALMGELLKQGITWDPFAYEMPFYSAKKHFDIDMSKWHDIPTCNW